MCIQWCCIFSHPVFREDPNTNILLWSVMQDSLRQQLPVHHDLAEMFLRMAEMFLGGSGTSLWTHSSRSSSVLVPDGTQVMHGHFPNLACRESMASDSTWANPQAQARRKFSWSLFNTPEMKITLGLRDAEVKSVRNLLVLCLNSALSRSRISGHHQQFHRSFHQGWWMLFLQQVAKARKAWWIWGQLQTTWLWTLMSSPTRCFFQGPNGLNPTKEVNISIPSTKNSPSRSVIERRKFRSAVYSKRLSFSDTWATCRQVDSARSCNRAEAFRRSGYPKVFCWVEETTTVG